LNSLPLISAQLSVPVGVQGLEPYKKVHLQARLQKLVRLIFYLSFYSST
jgi:hypothetical protein